MRSIVECLAGLGYEVVVVPRLAPGFRFAVRLRWLAELVGAEGVAEVSVHVRGRFTLLGFHDSGGPRSWYRRAVRLAACLRRRGLPVAYIRDKPPREPEEVVSYFARFARAPIVIFFNGKPKIIVDW